jgi:hypothetical protein
LFELIFYYFDVVECAKYRQQKTAAATAARLMFDVLVRLQILYCAPYFIRRIKCAVQKENRDEKGIEDGNWFLSFTKL